jgi:hypothetical protein
MSFRGINPISNTVQVYDGSKWISFDALTFNASGSDVTLASSGFLTLLANGGAVSIIGSNGAVIGSTAGDITIEPALGSGIVNVTASQTNFSGNVSVAGQSFAVDSQIVLADRYIDINVGNTIPGPITSGIDTNSNSIGPTTDVAGAAFTATTVEVVSTVGFAVDDVIEIANASNASNRGRFAVASVVSATTLEIKTTPNNAPILQTTLVADTTVQGTVTKITVDAFRFSGVGTIETTFGNTSDASVWTWTEGTGGETLQIAYENGASGGSSQISTSAAFGTLEFLGDQAFVVNLSNNIDFSSNEAQIVTNSGPLTLNASTLLQLQSAVNANLEAVTGTLSLRGSTALTLNGGTDTLTWPATDGTANQIIATDGAGNLSFISQPASSETLQEAYEAGNQIITTSAEGDLIFGGTESLTATMGSSVSISSSSGPLALSTTALAGNTSDISIGTGNSTTGIAGTIDITGGASGSGNGASLSISGAGAAGGGGVELSSGDGATPGTFQLNSFGSMEFVAGLSGTGAFSFDGSSNAGIVGVNLSEVALTGIAGAPFSASFDSVAFNGTGSASAFNAIDFQNVTFNPSGTEASRTFNANGFFAVSLNGGGGSGSSLALNGYDSVSSVGNSASTYSVSGYTSVSFLGDDFLLGNSGTTASVAGDAAGLLSLAGTSLTLNGGTDTLTWPAVDGSAGQIIQTDGAGVLSFVTPASAAQAYAIRPESTNATITAAEINAEELTIVCTAGGITITIPDPSTVNDAARIIIKDQGGNAGASQIEVTSTLANSIDGQTTQFIAASYASLTLQKTSASSWSVI